MQAFIDYATDKPVLYSGAILGFLIVFAKLFHSLFEKWLKKLVGKTKTSLDDKILEELVGPIYWSTLSSGLYFILLPLSLPSRLVLDIRNAILSFVIVIWTLAAVKVSAVVLDELGKDVEPGHQGIVSDFVPFARNIVKISLAVLSAFLILAVWQIDVTPLFVSAGVLGVAVAFAAKDTVSNLFGGLSVFVDKPYKIGDYVIIKDKYRGKVINIGMRSTKVRTRDNVLLTIPNSVMITDAVVNETGFDPTLRIRIPLGVSYTSNLDGIEKLLLSVLKSYGEILEKPSPRVRYRKFGPSAIELEILGVIEKPSLRGVIIHHLIKKIHKKFAEEEIIIPYPQQDVHLYKEK